MSKPGLAISESRLSLALGALAVLLAVIVFLPAARGEFVYDDDGLIVANAMIQDPRLFWTAMTSDVFAYRSAAGEATTPYWRPTTMAWFIMMHRLFGVAEGSTLGWHLGSIALHALTTGLAFALLRRLGAGPLVAGAAAIVFAVHPTRVENVAWISGVPDPLVAAGMLGTMLLVLRAREVSSPGARTALWAGAALVYALTLGAKEIAVVLPLILFFVLLPWGRGPGEPAAGEPAGAARPLWSRARPAILACLPFVGMAAVYLLIRYSIVGGVKSVDPYAPGLPGAIRSAPLVGAFYLRQMIAPIWLGPTYPLRPVADPGLTNFVLPLLICLAALATLVFLALGRPRSRVALVGLAILLLTAAPAALAPARAPELMVQDRYIYLPLLGLAVVLIAGIQGLLALRFPANRAGAAVFAGTILAAAPLAVHTYLYSIAWTSNLTLWTWAVRHDPTSRMPLAQLGNFLIQAEMYEDAANVLDRSLAIATAPTPLMARANAARKMGRFDEAESFAVRAVDYLRPYARGRDFFAAVDLLAEIRLQRAEAAAAASGGTLTDADIDPILDLYRDLQTRIPTMRVAATDRIAALLMAQGERRHDEALAELEAVRPLVAADRAPQSRMVLYRLGQIYSRRSRLPEALACFEEFLATQGAAHYITQQARDAAAQAVPELRRIIAEQQRAAPVPKPRPGGG